MSNEKKRYSLSIADMQINIISDASPETIDEIVGILDRKMREINLKNRSSSKSEAALMCALGFCADNMGMNARISELEEREGKYSVILEGFKNKTAKLEAELEELRRENAVLRSLLSAGESDGSGDTAEELPPINPVSPTEFLQAVAEESAAPADQEAEKPAEKPKGKVRSRVGSMFDLLSFNEP